MNNKVNELLKQQMEKEWKLRNINELTLKASGISSFQEFSNTQKNLENLTKGLSLELAEYSESLRKMTEVFRELAEQNTLATKALTETIIKFAQCEANLTSQNHSIIQDSIVTVAKQAANNINFLSKNFTKEYSELLSDIISQPNWLKDVYFDIDLKDTEIHSDGSLVYEGKNYTHEEVIKKSAQEAEQIKLNPEIIDNLKNNHPITWIILYAIYSIMLSLLLQYGGDFLMEKAIIPAIQYVSGTRNTAYILQENAYIRENSNPRSKIIIIVKYSEKLEILDTVPYWYQVKYTLDEKEYIGWISKKSVDRGGREK